MAAGRLESWEGAERVLGLKDTSSIIFDVSADCTYNFKQNSQQLCPYKAGSVVRFVGRKTNRGECLAFADILVNLGYLGKLHEDAGFQNLISDDSVRWNSDGFKRENLQIHLSVQPYAWRFTALLPLFTRRSMPNPLIHSANSVLI